MNNKIIHKIILVSIVISSFAVSQSKINVNHLLDYGGIKFMPNSDKPFNGKVFELYDNGAKHWEKRYIRGIAAGYYRSWYQNGQVEFKGRLENGVKNGLFTFYDKDGNKIKEEQYREGTLNGSFVSWYRNGNKNIECSYRDGQLDE